MKSNLNVLFPKALMIMDASFEMIDKSSFVSLRWIQFVCVLKAVEIYLRKSCSTRLKVL